MKKKLIKSLFLLISILLLTGCWDYVGLNQITIVTGVAIDKSESGKSYNLSFEFVNLMKSAKEKAVKTGIIESNGKTIFDAVRNAKKKALNKLYFANMATMIISNKIAKEDGIISVADWFLRDTEVREVIEIVISDEKSAKELLINKSEDNESVGIEILNIVEKDNAITASTKHIELYQVYNILKGKTQALTMSLFGNVKNDDKEVIEAKGIAVFKFDKMIGKLTPEESKYYLFVNNEVNGGILPYEKDTKIKESNLDNISLEISKSTTVKSFKYKNNKFKFTIEINIETFLGEFDNQPTVLNKKTTNDIIKKGENMIKSKIKNLIKKTKEEYKHDIFGLGNLIYQRNPSLWKKVKKQWDKNFIEAEFEIKPTIKIINTATTK